MNILFLTLADFKDVNERLIYSDLMKVFVEEGHRVSIVSPRERKYNEKTQLLEYENYKVLKVRIGNTQKTNMIERGITTLLIQKQFLSAIKIYLSEERYDLILYSTPPVTFAKVISYLKKRDSSVTYLMLKDIFPQNAVDIGLFSKKSFLYRYFRKKEVKLYALSDFIGCMSQANVNYLLKHNHSILPNIVDVCPNSIIPNKFIPCNKLVLRRKFKLPEKPILLVYGGNFGKPQAIEYIINVLKDNTNRKDRFFVLCGTGTEMYKLESYLKIEKPENVLLINGLQKTEYDELISACDIGLIFLDRRYTIPNFPSRMLPYMEYHLPIIAATDTNSDVGEVIVKGGFGWWCESKNSESFSKIIDEICLTPEIIQQKGNNARMFLENNYTAKHSYDIIMNHFLSTNSSIN
jgi:glycosyltransferase involved in cell wall biosynthesis